MNQLNLFVYGEAQGITEGEFCALGTLWHHWNATSAQFWYGRDGLPDSKGHAQWVKAGGSEWRPLDHHSHYFPEESARLLVKRGWAEIEVRQYFKREAICIRITHQGVYVHSRQVEACCRAAYKFEKQAKEPQPTRRKGRKK